MRTMGPNQTIRDNPKIHTRGRRYMPCIHVITYGIHIVHCIWHIAYVLYILLPFIYQAHPRAALLNACFFSCVTWYLYLVLHGMSGLFQSSIAMLLHVRLSVPRECNTQGCLIVRLRIDSAWACILVRPRPRCRWTSPWLAPHA